MKDKNYEIDNIDRQILEILSKNAKKPYTEVAKKVFVSGGTVHVRMKKMEDMGIVTGTTLHLDFSKLGYDITVFIGIFLEKSALYEQVIEKLKLIPEITNLHYTTGNYSIFAKMLCKDTTHLKNILYDKIQKIKGISRTDTMISLEESLKRDLVLS